MSKILLSIALMLFCCGIITAQNNIRKTAGVNYTSGPPTFTPSLITGSEYAIDTTNGWFYQFHRTTSLWLRVGQGIDKVSVFGPPTYAPVRNISWFAINLGDSLYHYSGTGIIWDCINCATGGGGAIANNGVSDNEDGGKIRLGNRYMASPDAPFTTARKINVDGRLLHIGDYSDSTLFVVDGATDRIGIRTDAPAKDLHVNGEIRISDLTNGTPDRVVGANSSGDISRLFLSGLSVSSGVLRAADSSATNEIQQIDTFAIVSNVLRASLSQDGVPFKSVDLSPYVNVGTNLTFTGASSPYTLNSSTGTDVTITQGAGITITRATNDLSIASTITQYTDENAQDAVGGILVDGTTIDFTYNDATPSVTAEVINNTITNAKIRQGAARSVIGVTGNSTANVADIQGTTDQVLRVNATGNLLEFGQVSTGGINNGAVSNAKIADRNALTVMGNPGNTSVAPQDIAATADGQVLRRSGTTLGFGTVATLGIADQAVTYVKIQNAVSDNVLLGNNNGANSSYEEINPAAAQNMLGYIDGNLVAGGRVAYSSDANTLTTEAAFLYSAANDRMTIVCNTPALGAGNAILNLQNANNDPSGEFLRMDGNITGNLLAGMFNSSTAAATDNTLFYISQAGNSAGDPIIQFNITGLNGATAAIGLDNSDANKLKISPKVPTPGGNGDQSLVATNDLIPLWGINKDAPLYTLDIGGQSRAIQYMFTNNKPTAGAAGNGLGTGGSIGVISGADNAFTLPFTTGSAGLVAGGPICTITYFTEWPSFAVPVFCQANDDAGNEISKFVFGTIDGAKFELKVRAGQTLTPSKTYRLHFVVGGQG